MKLLCLSHIDEQKFDVMSDSERETFIKECFAYDNFLRGIVISFAWRRCKMRKTRKHCATGTATCPSPTARTLKPRNKSAVFSCSMPTI